MFTPIAIMLGQHHTRVRRSGIEAIIIEHDLRRHSPLWLDYLNTDEPCGIVISGDPHAIVIDRHFIMFPSCDRVVHAVEGIMLVVTIDTAAAEPLAPTRPSWDESTFFGPFAKN